MERIRQLGLPQKEAMFEFQVLDVPAISDLQEMPLYCQTADTPEKSFSTIDLNFLQHTRRLPGKVEKHGNISVTFKLQRDMWTREMLNNWSNAIIDNIEGTGDGLDQWMGGAQLTMLDDQGEQGSNGVYRYNLEDCFLVTDSGGSFDHTGDSNVTMDAEIAYSNFTEEPLA